MNNVGNTLVVLLPNIPFLTLVNVFQQFYKLSDGSRWIGI